jgi:K+-transporting ATPase ATPase C chain
MRSTLNIAIRYTILTTILLGIVYPLIVTGLAQLTMRDKANGQLVVRNGQVIGSAIIGQGFTTARYFHSRPSAAGNGYDATSSGGSNLAQSNKALVTRVDGDVANWQKQNPGQLVPIGLVTTSASGLDPDISPADASIRSRWSPPPAICTKPPSAQLVESHIQGRQLGFLGEPRVNVLALNLALDDTYPTK